MISCKKVGPQREVLDRNRENFKTTKGLRNRWIKVNNFFLTFCQYIFNLIVLCPFNLNIAIVAQVSSVAPWPVVNC